MGNSAGQLSLLVANNRIILRMHVPVIPE